MQRNVGHGRKALDDQHERADRQPAGNSIISSIETHWSRILYSDLFTAATGCSTPDSDKEMFVTIKDTNDDASSDRMRSPIQYAAILLGFFIAMYVGLALVLNVLALHVLAPDVAAAPDRSMPPVSAAAASPLPAGVDQSPHDSLGQVSKRSDRAASSASDADCMCD